MSYFVYIIKCSDNTLYTGYTTDLEKRIRCHNEKKGAKYTRSRLPVTLVYSHEFSDQHTALQAEYFIKKQPTNDKKKLLSGELTIEEILKKCLKSSSSGSSPTTNKKE